MIKYTTLLFKKSRTFVTMHQSVLLKVEVSNHRTLMGIGRRNTNITTYWVRNKMFFFLVFKSVLL